MVFAGFRDDMTGISVYDTKIISEIKMKITDAVIYDMKIPSESNIIILESFLYGVEILDINTLEKKFSYTTLKQPWPGHLGLGMDTVLDISDDGNCFFVNDPMSNWYFNLRKNIIKTLVKPLERVYTCILDNKTFIAYYDGKINFWDADQFELIKSINCPPDYNGIAVYEHYAVLHNESKGFQFLDLLNPEKGPVQKVSLPTFKDIVKIPKRGKYAVVKGSANSPRMLIDIEKDRVVYSKDLKGSTDPTNEEAYDSYVEVTNDGTKMFVVKGNVVFIYDISKVSANAESGNLYKN